jgi:hypothetical protein
MKNSPSSPVQAGEQFPAGYGILQPSAGQFSELTDLVIQRLNRETPNMNG